MKITQLLGENKEEIMSKRLLDPDRQTHPYHHNEVVNLASHIKFRFLIL